MPPCVIVGDWGGYEATVSRLLAQISTPMTAISEGKNSWVSRACVGSNCTVNMDKLCCWRRKLVVLFDHEEHRYILGCT